MTLLYSPQVWRSMGQVSKKSEGVLFVLITFLEVSKCELSFLNIAGVADKLDSNRKILQTRYYRQHCTLDLGSYTKDLSNISHDLSSIFILDNSPGAYRSYPANAMPIKSWFSDPTDTALLNLLPVLDALRFTQDVRSVLSRNLHVHRPW